MQFRSKAIITSCALALCPLVAQAQETSFVAGVGVERENDETRVVPVLTAEFGRLSVGLDQTSYSLSDSDSNSADIGLSYDFDGNVDVFASTYSYISDAFYAGVNIGQSLNDEGAYLVPDVGYEMSFGYVDVQLAAGVELFDAERSIAEYEQAGLPSTTSPYVSVSTLIPLSETTAVLGEASATFFDSDLVTAGAVDSDVGFDFALYLVREF